MYLTFSFHQSDFMQSNNVNLSRNIPRKGNNVNVSPNIPRKSNNVNLSPNIPRKSNNVNVSPNIPRKRYISLTNQNLYKAIMPIISYSPLDYIKGPWPPPSSVVWEFFFSYSLFSAPLLLFKLYPNSRSFLVISSFSRDDSYSCRSKP